MTEVIELKTKAQFDDAIAAGRVVIDFARRFGCVPCQRLEPHFKAAANAPVLEDITFYKVMLDEVDDEFLDYIMDRVGIMSTPTVLEYRYNNVYAEIKERVAIKIIKELTNE